MERKKKLKSSSWITRKSQKESADKRSASSFEIEMTLGNAHRHIAHQPVSAKDDFAEGRQPWAKLLFDVKIGQKCKSYHTKQNFSKSSPVSCSGLLLEPQDSSCKLSDLLGDVTIEDWSSHSYLILMTLREDDNLGVGDKQLHDTEVAHLDMNKISSDPKFESRPTMTSVRPLKELCQTAKAVYHLEYQGSPAAEIPKHLDTCDNLRQIETCQLFYSVPSLQNLSRVAVERLHRLRTNTNSTSEKNLRTSLSSKGSLSMVSTLRNLCEAVTSGLHEQHMLSKETEGRNGTAPSMLETTSALCTIPNLRHLARMAVKSLGLNSSKDKGSNIPSFEDPKKSCTIPRLHDFAEKAVKARETRSAMENKKQIYTVPSLRDLTEMLVKSLPSNSRERVSTSSELGSSEGLAIVTEHLFTVPSLRQLCQVVVDGLKSKPKEKDSLPTKSNDSQQKIPSLLELKVTRPRTQRRPRVPASGFPLPTRAPMPHINFNRPMFPIGSRYIMPRTRMPITGQPFWRMNRPPPNFWPRGGACEGYGVPSFGPRYGRF